MNGILQGMGKPMVPVIALSIGMIFKVIISYTLTGMPEINIFGSALGTVSAYLIAVLIELAYIKKNIGIKFSVKEFVIRPLITFITMFISVKLGYGLLVGALGNSLSTVVSIAIGAVVYVVVLILLGGIKKEEIMTMPKGDKIYRLLKKLNLMK